MNGERVPSKGIPHIYSLSANLRKRMFVFFLAAKPLIVFINIADHKSLETMRNILYVVAVKPLNMLVGI